MTNEYEEGIATAPTVGDIAGQTLRLTEDNFNPVQAELDELLAHDTTQLGEAFRLIRETPDITPTQMADTGSFANSGVASNLRQQLKAIQHQQLPSSPAVAQMTARRVSAMLRREVLTDTLRAYLSKIKVELERIGADEELQEAEVDELRESGERALAQEETSLQPCIYVYSLPHYLRYPSSGAGTDDERHWVKVGVTTRDPRHRLSEQMRQTALPEDPILLRVFRNPQGGDVARAERAIHSVLEGFGQRRASGRQTGREWFLTSLAGLDALASAMGLKTDYTVY